MYQLGTGAAYEVNFESLPELCCNNRQLRDSLQYQRIDGKLEA